MANPPMIYVGSTNIDNWLPGFRDRNDIFVQNQDPSHSLWIGNQSRVAPHMTFLQILPVQLQGEKALYFLPSRTVGESLRWTQWISRQRVNL